MTGVLSACLPAPHAALNRASDLYQSGHYDEAAREYQHVIDMRPSWAPPYLGLGNARWALNQRTGAVDAYRRAVALSPDWVEALTSLGRALLDLDRPSEAVPVLTHAVQLDPTDSTATSLLREAQARAASKIK
jgi:cytochrome c-type biogenesis protein CcmH/NrfG